MTHHAAIIGREDAEQGVRSPVHLQGAAKRGGVGGETFAPEAVAHDRDRGAFVVLGVEASGGRMDAKEVEEVGAGVHGPDDLVAAGTLPDGVVKPGVEGQVLEDAVGAQVAVARVGDAGVDASEAIRLYGADIVEDHLAGDAVGGDVGADSQGERRDGDCGESGGFAKAANGVAEIGQHLV